MRALSPFYCNIAIAEVKDHNTLIRCSHRENPEAQKVDYEEYFETENQREMRQIFTGQSQMFDVLRELNRKLDEIVGRQERTLSLISQVQVGGESLIPCTSASRFLPKCRIKHY